MERMDDVTNGVKGLKPMEAHNQVLVHADCYVEKAVG
jgi:hypothetical protein